MRITVVKNWKGQEEVHEASCADLKRRNRPYRLAEALTMDAESLFDLYAVYWECIDDESVAAGDYPTKEAVWEAWSGEFSVKPCAASLPTRRESEPEPEPEPAKRTKFQIRKEARAALWAGIESMLNDSVYASQPELHAMMVEQSERVAMMFGMRD